MFKKNIACGFEVKVEADSVLGPEVIYGDSITAIYFEDKNGKFCRVTFERLDSIRICRGEYCPYEDDWVEGSPYRWVSKVKGSSWLKERFEYESRYYKDAYGFCGNVSEMLSEFSHYLFSFHDQYVEVLAAGIWFEVSGEPINKDELCKGHPFLPLPSKNEEKISAHDLLCKARLNPLNTSELIENAVYCSQPLMDFTLELGVLPRKPPNVTRYCCNLDLVRLSRAIC